LIEPATFLPALMQDFYAAGGKIVVTEFPDRSQESSLDESVIINCIGLGSRDLFSDNGLIPIKGQLTFLLPQPEVEYIMISGGLYMFPRSDGILLGGSFERKVFTPEPDPQVAKSLSGP
jgi:glycine/D-amino acid oxidase-like deaminating enzyme